MDFSQQHIADFIHALSDIPATDLLVNLPEVSKGMIRLEKLPGEKFSIQIDGSWKFILQIAVKFRLEADVNSLCLVFGVLTSRVPGRESTSPLLLIPLNWHYQRITNTLQLELNEETLEVNPYIRFLYSELSGKSLEEFPTDSTLAEKFAQIKNLLEDLDQTWNVKEEFIIGNFHYHRFHMLRELEGIEKSDAPKILVNQLLGNDFGNLEVLHLPEGLLSPSDADQLRVFQTLKEKNVLLQGPPGTGKSQVLINILGKSVKSRLKCLTVSEKRVALEVILKKLSEQNLDAFAFVIHSQTRSSDLLKQLKRTWNLLETETFGSGNNLRLSEQLNANLQLLLDRLNLPDYFAGVSYKVFCDLVRETPLNRDKFSTRAPSLDEWLKVKSIVQELDLKLEGFSMLRGLKPRFFEKWNGDQLAKKSLEKWKDLQEKLGDLVFLKDLDQTIAALGRCQLVENEQYKVYSGLALKPKEWKKFQNWVRAFFELEEKLNQEKQEIHIWKQVPSQSQLDSWDQAASWIQLRKRKKAIARLLKDTSVLPEIAVSNWKNYLATAEEWKNLERYFIGLGLNPVRHELELGLIYAAALQRESGTLLSEIATWTSAKRKAVITCGPELKDLYDTLTNYFKPGETLPLESFLRQKEQDFVVLTSVYETLKSLPGFFFELVENADSWQELQALILFSSLCKIESLNPELVKFSGEELHERLDQLIETEDEEQADFAESIRYRIQQDFEAFEALLRIPAQKLTAEQKEQKFRLKKGKSILVKEFAKSRNHLTIRNLLASDAKEWIQLLIPVWLATPGQVADHFPLEAGLFDLVLFDEASQIPLPNALGSLFRSKRALVAGDEQQMAPTSYFGKHFGFHDLLHQAAYYFEKVSLRHHYRSENSELIRFSNAHFYRNELIVYPSVSEKQVLFHHLVKNGIFDERRNRAEAGAVAAFLEQFPGWGHETLGIVAFSEEQLKTIRSECSDRIQELLTIGQEEGTLFFKALENVQGDEADVLIISLGYAKNPEGFFHMRFGPLNQANGYKRLNVLLTRAKKELHFFSSVSSGDFQLSENESVNLLRRFLTDLEENQIQKSHIIFPYRLQEETVSGNTACFKHIYSKIPDSRDLLTFHRLMKQRGWKLEYE
ncbi:ATP-binding protein [Fluviicola sp.]|jgi:hypothetical protein|uniref:DEAD/DEAH box helicase n=1 Tax=Fluviicola sp. TaxID=1917219 RepID=UPI00281779EC|nr:ATP-binding protein [Fluviicola sp.]MDR0802692.1 ATP-binding protein [Fluviicola sp.]